MPDAGVTQSKPAPLNYFLVNPFDLPFQIEKKQPSQPPQPPQPPQQQKPSPEAEEADTEKTKLSARHSSPPKTTQSTTNSVKESRPLKRVTSVPVETVAPPPPPPLPAARVEVDDEPRGAEIVEVVEEPTLRPSQIVKSMCRSMSAICK